MLEAGTDNPLSSYAGAKLMAIAVKSRCGLLLATLLLAQSAVSEVRLKELGRFDGVRENELIGYGLVVGLAGTGDTPANRATLQSIANTLIDFGVNVDLRDLRSRNTAAVMVAPPYSRHSSTRAIR